MHCVTNATVHRHTTYHKQIHKQAHINRVCLSEL